MDMKTGSLALDLSHAGIGIEYRTVTQRSLI